jgi:hypothetical protein
LRRFTIFTFIQQLPSSTVAPRSGTQLKLAALPSMTAAIINAFFASPLQHLLSHRSSYLAA